jgi:hypothetical protein
MKQPFAQERLGAHTAEVMDELNLQGNSQSDEVT